LREALKVLAKKGLIESRPRTGTRVRPREHWNLLDPDVIAWQYEIGLDGSFLQAICEVRLMFEPMSAGLAAARATASEIDTIEEYCRRMEEALDTVEAYTAIDLQFHAAICAAAHNELIQQIMATLAIPLFASRIVTSHLPGANRLAMPLHRTVAEAIRQRDDQVAENTMRQIVTLTARDIQRALDNKDERKEERA
jgi:DNA-binding FadR family transcriptional regulator